MGKIWKLVGYPTNSPNSPNALDPDIAARIAGILDILAEKCPWGCSYLNTAFIEPQLMGSTATLPGSCQISMMKP